ncbi:M1 family metallopeptidase [Brevibacillus sp. GCM10020057]|uniref:M1 family metallopeptidase n=1 Tax=Brevibacillus sp. GCM10020057 TaxID=3317327 RepID=UPI00363648EF
MKNWLAVLGIAFLAWSLAIPAAADEQKQPLSRETLYKADVRIDPQKRQVAGSVEIRFWPKDAERAYVHLYPLAFTEEHKSVLWDELLGKDVEPGTYDNTRIAVEGKQAAAKRIGDVIEVPLAQTEGMPAGETEPVRLQLDFSMTLPRNDGRMSYDDHAMWLGNWLPILAVRDQQGWHLDPYEPIGDPFFSETANYEVNVTLPDSYQLASTATDHAAIVDSTVHGQKTYRLQAGNVRDFALVVMDATYHVLETKAGNTVVRTWYREKDSLDQAKGNHLAAVQSLRYFGSQFGTYPYTEYDVVRTGGSINGMEYPSIVFLDGRHFQPGGGSYGVVTTVHETAHQWFYSLVGNNQVDDAWLDEGFAEYATLAFLAESYPDLAESRVLLRQKRGMDTQEYVQEHLRPWQALHAFPDNQSYSDLVYSRTSAMLWALREAWGEERLHDALRQYVSTNRYGIASGSAWKALLADTAGEDAGAFLDYWINLDVTKKEEAAAWLERQRFWRSRSGQRTEEMAEK